MAIPVEPPPKIGNHKARNVEPQPWRKSKTHLQQLSRLAHTMNHLSLSPAVATVPFPIEASMARMLLDLPKVSYRFRP